MICEGRPQYCLRNCRADHELSHAPDPSPTQAAEPDSMGALFEAIRIRGAYGVLISYLITQRTLFILVISSDSGRIEMFSHSRQREAAAEMGERSGSILKQGGPPSRSRQAHRASVR